MNRNPFPVVAVQVGPRRDERPRVAVAAVDLHADRVGDEIFLVSRRDGNRRRGEEWEHDVHAATVRAGPLRSHRLRYLCWREGATYLGMELLERDDALATLAAAYEAAEG